MQQTARGMQMARSRRHGTQQTARDRRHAADGTQQSTRSRGHAAEGDAADGTRQTDSTQQIARGTQQTTTQQTAMQQTARGMQMARSVDGTARSRRHATDGTTDDTQPTAHSSRAHAASRWHAADGTRLCVCVCGPRRAVPRPDVGLECQGCVGACVRACATQQRQSCVARHGAARAVFACGAGPSHSFAPGAPSLAPMSAWHFKGLKQAKGRHRRLNTAATATCCQ